MSRFRIALIALFSSWAVVGHAGLNNEQGDTEAHAEWLAGPKRPADLLGDEKPLRSIPQYVLDYAPLVHLHSREPFWPGQMDRHLEETTPYLNEEVVDEVEQNLSLDELGNLNAHIPPWWVFLKSNERVKKGHPVEFPQWLVGEENIPVDPKKEGWEGERDDGEDMVDVVAEDDDWSAWFDVGAPNEAAKLPPTVKTTNSADLLANLTGNNHSPGGRSSAPVILVVVEKENEVVDAFWFYFYHYNLGNSVFGIRFGNHVGDWEHNMIRFHKGVPKVVFFSEHAGGASYTYKAVEKIGRRPRVYSATGTHAMYAKEGIHPYVLPFSMLHDTTDRGPLWDPLRNLYAYHYNTTLAGDSDRNIWSVRGENLPSPPASNSDMNSLVTSDFQAKNPWYDPVTDPETLTPSSLTPNAPTSWFYFCGHWGDKDFNKTDPRQYEVLGEKAYVAGPMGPRWKALGRRMPCTSRFACTVKTTIEPRHWILQFIIDWFVLIAFLLGLMAFMSLIIGGLRCCIYCGRRGTRRIVMMRQKKAESDIEDAVVGETTSLLANADVDIVVIDERENAQSTRSGWLGRLV